MNDPCRWFAVFLAALTVLRSAAADEPLQPAVVLGVMERVADWQLANPGKHAPTDWTQGALYTGIMALDGISGSARFREAMVRMGETNAWKPGPRKFHGDDHVVGQTYVELWQRYREPRMLVPLKARFDDLLAQPSQVTSLEFKQPGGKALENWSWCDALFMAPPAWLRLYRATGNRAYLDFATTNWWRTSAYLYDTNEHLYFRDSTYFEKREANGQKVFWSRGNGWVMGGLVRMLQWLPDNHPDRVRFVQQYLEMADKILAAQQPDGLWRSSLLDPTSYPLKETSGSGFYTYALAWGINQRLLDRPRFEPAVRKAWSALVACVAPDGKLTHVQPIGADPKKFDENWSDVFGVGAFLLAGSEVYRLAVDGAAKSAPVEVRNPSATMRQTETVEFKLADLAERLNLPAAEATNLVVRDGVSSRIMDSQLLASQPGGVPDRIIFQVDLAPLETRTYRVLDRRALAAVPPPVVKTFARFVPERLDDFAWESDRIAHRVYGPAIMSDPKEKLVSSGVDVWVKRTRRPVINDWYRTGKYHEDHGDGLDCYKVGTARGCGGLGFWDGGRLFVSSNFCGWKVVNNGPIRAEFILEYPAWSVPGGTVSETRLVSIDAGSNLSRVESVFKSDAARLPPVALGIVERKGEGASVTREATGAWLTHWEPAQGKNGSTACAVVVPGARAEFASDGENLLLLTPVPAGRPFVYFLGAGWSNSGDFPDARAWDAYVSEVAQRVRQPAVVAVR